MDEKEIKFIQDQIGYTFKNQDVYKRQTVWGIGYKWEE